MIYGVCGFIGSGKDTVADYLVSNHNFVRESFAGTLKDAVASIFGWDREMLEGRTSEARAARDVVDQWWATRLGNPKITPRYILQIFGTEVCRRNLHDDIWIASVEHKLRNETRDVIISDCRFPNEIKTIRSLGGKILRVQRGPEPDWYETAVATNRGEIEGMNLRSDVHPSEWSWAGTDFDAVLDNNGTIEGLYSQIKSLVASRPAST